MTFETETLLGRFFLPFELDISTDLYLSHWPFQNALKQGSLCGNFFQFENCQRRI